jgi:hypothetical protein
MIDLSALPELMNVPELMDKYVSQYLQLNDLSKMPFIAPMPFGPIPEGCSKLELLLGLFTLPFEVEL